MTSQYIGIYILKSVIIAGILFLYYWLILRDKKFHYYNRFYLLGALTLSIIIPFFKSNTLKLRSKYGDFETFCCIMKMVHNKDHLQEAGLRKIYKLKQKMH